ncbi:flagellar biosynthesis protein FlhB [Glaciimonas soli]|uniref:Flagellar biosynthetic protein FlhB n=1 Tax=Glaciimonas soli TaxID=2590999 RepID=A0A843YPJ7_9BURK|nr:flagellar biosynthesis protein FlhB [Glaciimonas soli]MQQ99472.1 flagellar type III secretion system protein FlhB [Glaciimonas soli]
MSDDSDVEKTEPASPQRLEKARKEGQVVRSRELSTFILLITGVAGLWIFASSMSEHLSRAMMASMQFERASAFDTSHMLTRVGMVWIEALVAILPLLGMLALAAIAAPMLLGGWLFSIDALAPKFSKMNPINGIGRIFSVQSLTELIKAILKSLLVGGIAYLVISSNIDSIMALLSEPVHSALPYMMRLVATCCALIVFSLLLVAAIDVPYQLWSFHKKLRMSLQDVKQEYKDSEGDPHLKSKIRRQQQRMASQRMMSEVATADVVVTNPTHYAVALKYMDKEMSAPRVVAKGTDLIAQRIRELALDNKVPILEAPPLSRALYKHTKLGNEIPADLYTAVAEVLAWVYQLKRWKDGHTKGVAPLTPTQLAVPPELDPHSTQAKAAVNENIESDENEMMQDEVTLSTVRNQVDATVKPKAGATDSSGSGA